MMDDFYTSVAAELHAIADAVAGLAGRGLPEANVTLRVWPHGDDDATSTAAIDAVGTAVLGRGGAPLRMPDGSYHHDVRGRRGPVEVTAYHDIEAPERRALREEIERSRAELARLRAEVDAAQATVADVDDDGSEVAQ
jgi:hypothetical protein